MSILLPLKTKDKYAIIDNEFYDELNNYRWYATKDYNTYYAVCYIKDDNNKIHTVRMHRLIVSILINRDLDKNEQIDHIDHNGLNNTCNNLRIVTNAQNQYNAMKRKSKTTSRFKGVRYDKYYDKWIANITVDGKNMRLGTFPLESLAANEYDCAALFIFGDYAYTNFSYD